MAQVTIEGSRTMPSDALGRGERRTVEVTDDIRQLVRIGAVTVVEGSLKAPPTDFGESVTVDQRNADLSRSISAGILAIPQDASLPPAAEVPTDEPPAKRGRSRGKTSPTPPAEESASGEG